MRKHHPFPSQVTILSVFKWEERKGYDVLLDAFFEAFDAADGVRLVVHSYKPSWSPGDPRLDREIDARRRARCGASSAACAPVLWHGSTLDRPQMRALYAAADVFALPTRGEGWGLPVHEAMAMGLPTIVTNFSGPSELASGDTVFFLDPHDTDARGYAQPTAADLAKLLRHVVDHLPDARAAGARARRRVADRFSPPTIAKTVANALAAARAAAAASRSP